jgi:hypothetical protein
MNLTQRIERIEKILKINDKKLEEGYTIPESYTVILKNLYLKYMANSELGTKFVEKGKYKKALKALEKSTEYNHKLWIKIRKIFPNIIFNGEKYNYNFFKNTIEKG